MLVLVLSAWTKVSARPPRAVMVSWSAGSNPATRCRPHQVPTIRGIDRQTHGRWGLISSITHCAYSI
jgi:hypothetical protein